jgi:hypothetical protein
LYETNKKAVSGAAARRSVVGRPRPGSGPRGRCNMNPFGMILLFVLKVIPNGWLLRRQANL